jgi:hypothetical protein
VERGNVVRVGEIRIPYRWVEKARVGTSEVDEERGLKGLGVR